MPGLFILCRTEGKAKALKCQSGAWAGPAVPSARGPVRCTRAKWVPRVFPSGEQGQGTPGLHPNPRPQEQGWDRLRTQLKLQIVTGKRVPGHTLTPLQGHSPPGLCSLLLTNNIRFCHDLPPGLNRPQVMLTPCTGFSCPHKLLLADKTCQAAG